jgi:hypothetical protein
MMTSATWSEPLSGTATGGGSVTAWFSLLWRWVRGAVSPAEAPKLEQMQATARTLGAPVLEATSRQDMRDRLDAALERPELTELMRESARTLTVDALASVAISAEELAAMEPVLGKGPTAIIASTSPLVSACGGMLARLVTSSEMRMDELPSDWHDILYAPDIHSTIKRSLLGNMRAWVATAAISHAVFQGRHLEPWLALALVEAFRDELYLAMRWFASLPVGADLPESVVPLHDRFNLTQLAAEVEANEFLWNGVAGLAGDQLSLCEVPDDDPE